jgi:lipid A 3-O-deacylase
VRRRAMVLLAGSLLWGGGEVRGQQAMAGTVLPGPVGPEGAAEGMTAAPPQPRPTALDLALDNDAFANWLPWRRRSDREYTHGLWVAGTRGDAPLWGRLRPEPGCDAAPAGAGRCAATRWVVGQRLFTPRIYDDAPAATERPYAAWLFGAGEARLLEGNAARSVRLEVGVTGRPALGAPVQRAIHRVVGIRQPRGWEHQLPFEPGFLVRYAETRVLERRAPSGARIADVAGTATLTAGTVRTGAEATLVARVGYGIPHALRSGWSRRAEHGTGGFAFVRVQPRWAVRDLFLDGSTFRESPRVEKRPFPAAAEVGAAFRHAGWQLSYSLTGETRQYRTQPRQHVYSSIRLRRER